MWRKSKEETSEGFFKHGQEQPDLTYNKRVNQSNTEYRGQWRAGKKEGFGILKTSHGEYIGQFVNDQLEGDNCTFVSIKEKKSYVGQWGKGKPHG